ncbi:MAG: heparinase II/III family protein, partial [Planctomycetes bacterium]|nr:heparinase II/III family protein [Planctomycetota bacterium]
LFDRSVASHNTVQVDSQDQAEFIGSFRTGWRYRARCETVRSDDGSFELIGSHDAYQCGSQRITHRRRFFATSDRFTIEDRLILCDRHGNEKTEPSIASAASSDRSAAVFGQVARARFLFHDACRLEQVSDSSIRIRVGSSSIVMQASTVIRIIPAEWSPDFGVRVATHLVEATFASVPGSASFQFALEA